jgi:hypothetical protein
MSAKTPWAVLVCWLSDDSNNPATVKVSELWGIADPDPNDPQTALDLFTDFFTAAGTQTYNAVRFFDDMSHGAVDLSGSAIFVVRVNLTKAQAGNEAGGVALALQVTQAAKAAALQQGVPLGDFYGVVITSHAPLAMAQGDRSFGGTPWAGMDYRWVKNNGIQSWGQEMGHAYGLGHSRREGSPEDYRDPWDIMSTRAASSAPDPDYGNRGPGLNAWNMRGRGWLDESRVWKPGGDNFDQTIELRPLHRRDLAGWLAAELPPRDKGEQGRYLVEFRVKQGWDQGFPRSAVFVHRYEDEQHSVDGWPHSYVMPGTQQNDDLVQGDIFDPALPITSPRVDVLAIDEANLTATVRLRCHGLLTNVAPAAAGRKAADGSGYLFVFATAQDGRILVNQAATGGAFVGWQEVPGGVTTDGPVGTGMQGDTLFVFARTQDGQILFNQAAAGGAFVGWQEMPGE